ncbi:NERD domain-containing protein [Planctopirus hydrillae]|nr:NERD domain-containing protein [Planctopirus hydrillae]
MSHLRGWFGEICTRLGLWFWLPSRTYRQFHNIVVPTSNGTTQIDHLIVSTYGLFVIETKNMKGWIYGNEQDSQWTQKFRGTSYRFQNPLKQNYRHLCCLEEHLGLPRTCMHSIIFFIGEAELKTPMPGNVLTHGLSSYIRRHREPLLSEQDVEQIIAAIQELKRDRTLNHATHMASLADRHSSTTRCPKCGSDLIERQSKKGDHPGSTFLGCKSYPRCRFTRQLSQEP